MACALVLSACGGGNEHAGLPGMVAVEVPGPTDPMREPIKAYQGTVVMVGACGVGVVRVVSDYADVDTFAGGVDGIAQSSQRWLREGQLMVVCGAVHKVLGFAFDDEVVAGSTGRALLLDANPSASVHLTPGSAVLTMDGVVRAVGPGRATLKGLSIALQSGRAVARFRISTRDGGERGAVGGPGDVIEIAGHHHIVDVRPVDAAAGIPGWVEIEAAPFD